MSVTVTNGDAVITHPLAWKTGPVTFFAALPTIANSPLFDDLLLDFYGAAQLPPSAVCVRIDGYHCHQDHVEFRHLVDYLHQSGIAFIVGVIPAYWNPETKKIEELDPNSGTPPLTARSPTTAPTTSANASNRASGRC
ncbi:MAG: DUF2334 domain-containing protein [Verrucomicrobia bacterium]|nr:DUF2334 domain-containing protein [Verrucomicrobiota bacterium]